MEEMTLRDTLLAFGEWLDTNRGCYDNNHPRGGSGAENLTHEQVADLFIQWWEKDENRAPLPGGPQSDKIVVKVHDGVFAEDDIMIAIRGSHGRWYGRNVREEDLRS